MLIKVLQWKKEIFGKEVWKLFIQFPGHLFGLAGIRTGGQDRVEEVQCSRLSWLVAPAFTSGPLSELMWQLWSPWLANPLGRVSSFRSWKQAFTINNFKKFLQTSINLFLKYIYIFFQMWHSHCENYKSSEIEIIKSESLPNHYCVLKFQDS